MERAEIGVSYDVEVLAGFYLIYNRLEPFVVSQLFRIIFIFHIFSSNALFCHSISDYLRLFKCSKLVP